MDVEYDLKGLDELEAKIKSISHDMQYKGGRAALRKAANLIRAKAKANAERLDDPATKESIAKNIAVRWNSKGFKQRGELGFRIGVLGGASQYADTRENRRKKRVGKTFITDGSKGNPGGDTWHWRLVEFGTEHSAAKPFMRTALANHVPEVMAEFVRQYDKALQRAINRAKKGN